MPPKVKDKYVRHGDFIPGAKYVTNDRVMHKGVEYICRNSNLSDQQEDPEFSTRWKIMT